MKKILVLSILVWVMAGCAPVRPNFVTPPPLPSPSVTTRSTAVTQPAVPSTPAPAATAAPSANTASDIPNFDHIFLIVLENEGYATALNSASMPHLVDLAKKYVLLSNYFAASHPSLPNYIALVSGSTQNITSDCMNCFVNGSNLADEIEKSGRTWKAYMESMPSPCFIGNADPYAQKHNPLLYFDSIRLNAARCENSIVPLSQLDNDLKANKLPNFSYIMPNLCDSGHDCSAATADNWLNGMVSKLQASPTLGLNSLIIITFDEAKTSDKTSCCGLGKGGGKVATVLISPLAKAGFTDDTAYSHYSLLKTILTAWNLPSLGKTNESTIEPILAPWAPASVSPNPTSTP